MKSATKTKTGRKQKHHKTADGKQIFGLAKRPSDGRWRIIGTQITFSEPDEEKAIEKFYQLRPSSEPADAVVKRLQGDAIHFNNRQQLWSYFAEQLQADPKNVAELTGLPTLQWFKSYHAPELLPTLKDIRDNWTKHKKTTPESVSKVARFWDKFVEETEIKSIDEITPQLAIAYQDFIYSEGYNGKTQSHLFSGVRSIVNFARMRAMAPSAMNKALECLRLMTPSETTVNRNPIAIERADFHKLLEKTEGQNKAMLLMMLNCALYLGEVVSIKWEEIKTDAFVSRRKKRGQCVRVATLWPETIAALNELPRKSEYVFLSKQGGQLNKFTAFERFRAIRTKAELGDTITPSHFRDGAFTAAISANVSSELANILVGHTNGLQDNYVMSKPSIVKPACDAVRAAYFA